MTPSVALQVLTVLCTLREGQPVRITRAVDVARDQTIYWVSSPNAGSVSRPNAGDSSIFGLLRTRAQQAEGVWPPC